MTERNTGLDSSKKAAVSGSSVGAGDNPLDTSVVANAAAQPAADSENPFKGVFEEHSTDQPGAAIAAEGGVADVDAALSELDVPGTVRYFEDQDPAEAVVVQEMAASNERTLDESPDDMDIGPAQPDNRQAEFFRSHRVVEELLAENLIDLESTKPFVDIRDYNFTPEDLSTIPASEVRSTYILPFAKQLFDRNEGIFTKQFWTSLEGIKKVLTAGFVKAVPKYISFEAADWLMHRTEGSDTSPDGGTSAAPVEPSSETLEEGSRAEIVERGEVAPVGTEPTAATKADNSIEAESKPVPQTAMSSMETTVREAKKPVDKKPALESQVLTAQALKEIEARIQKKLERLQKRIVPETVTIRLDDPNGAKNLLALQDYGKRFGTAFAEQATKVTEALKEVAQIGLDQPHQAIAFKRKREQALALVDTLSFSERKLEAAVSQGTDTKLPNSMREAMSNASDIFNSIKSDIEEVRRLIKTARRIIPTATAEHNSTSPSGTEPKVEVKTGSVASMPRLGKDLTIDPRKLVAMGHAMVEGIISDADLKESYRQVMSDFVTSYVRNFSNIRKEIYQSRIDGSEMNDLQKERLRFLAEVLGTETKVSDLYKLSSSRREQLDESFLSVMDSSPFQKALNEMKSEFAAALTKELDKKPGTEDTDTTYVAFKREKFETTEGFKRYEQAEKKQDEITRLSKEKQVLTTWLSELSEEDLKGVKNLKNLTPNEVAAVEAAIQRRQETMEKRALIAVRIAEMKSRESEALAKALSALKREDLAAAKTHFEDAVKASPTPLSAREVAAQSALHDIWAEQDTIGLDEAVKALEKLHTAIEEKYRSLTERLETLLNRTTERTTKDRPDFAAYDVTSGPKILPNSWDKEPKNESNAERAPDNDSSKGESTSG